MENINTKTNPTTVAAKFDLFESRWVLRHDSFRDCEISMDTHCAGGNNLEHPNISFNDLENRINNTSVDAGFGATVTYLTITLSEPTNERKKWLSIYRSGDKWKATYGWTRDNENRVIKKPIKKKNIITFLKMIISVFIITFTSDEFRSDKSEEKIRKNAILNNNEEVIKLISTFFK